MSRLRVICVLALGLIGAVAMASVAPAAKTSSAKRMVSTKLGPRLCETTYGGKFVDIAEFPGERIDRRLLTDLGWLEAKYKIFVTDAYSMDGVHASNGEHPIGLAADIVPNKAAGGTWNDIDRLAAWAEPTQDHPRAPFRWVGYDGDSGHGRGNHLHLSWSHSDTKPGIPALTVDTIFCPAAPATTPTSPTTPEPPTPTGATTPTTSGGGGGGGRGGGGRNGDDGDTTKPSGTTTSPSGGTTTGGGGSRTGGIHARAGFGAPILPPVAPDYHDH